MKPTAITVSDRAGPSAPPESTNEARCGPDTTFEVFATHKRRSITEELRPELGRWIVRSTLRVDPREVHGAIETFKRVEDQTNPATLERAPVHDFQQVLHGVPR